MAKTIEAWLKEHDGWSQYLPGFTHAGYKKLDELRDHDDAALVLEDVVADEITRKAMMKSLVLENEASPAKKPDNGGGDGPKVPIPKLPAGTLIDLSADIVIDDVQFEVPARFPVESGARLLADQLTMEQWLSIAKRTKVLHAIRMDELQGDLPERARTFDLTGSQVLARKPALVWKVPANNNFFTTTQVYRSKSELAYTSRESKAREHTMFSASLSGAYAFCAASAEATHESASAHADKVQRLYMFGLWHQPRAILHLDMCTAPSEEFLDAINLALSAETENEKFLRLKDVFTEYGHVVYDDVTLGGTRFFTTTRRVYATADKEAVKTAVAAAAEIKSTGKSGSAAAGFSTEEGKAVTAQEIAQEVSWTTVGGLDGDMGQWQSSLDDPNEWALIDHSDTPQRGPDGHHTGESGPTSLIDKLDPGLREEVLSVWRSGLRRTWGVETDEDVPLPHITPAFHGEAVTIGTSLFVSDENRRNVLGAYNGFGGDTNIMNGDYAALSHWYPPRVSASLANDAERNNLLWVFVYAKKRDQATGLPIYRIVTRDGKWALSSTVERVFGHHIAILTRAPSELNQPVSTSDATWLVMPADPGKYYGEPAIQGSWLIKNARSRYLLSGSQTWIGRDQRTTLRNIEPALRDRSLPVKHDGWPEHKDSVANCIWNIKVVRSGA